MTIGDRRRKIFEIIESRGQIDIIELSTFVNVSEMTVRRDLMQLEREGLIKRTHGGAILATPSSFEPPYAVRAQKAVEAKLRIGKLAASLVADGETVILDVGTTTAEVAKELRGCRNLTVFTPSLHIATILAEEPGINVILSGGTLRKGEGSLIGDLARRAFDELIFDIFIMGIAGIHSEIGLTEYNLQDSQTKRAALKAARRCIVVADSSKLGRVAFAKICGLDQIDVLVTDNLAPDKLQEFQSTGLEIKIG